MKSGPLFTLEERTQRFVDALENHHSQAAFFCIGCDCVKEGSKTLKLLQDKGHFLANHSFYQKQ